MRPYRIRWRKSATHDLADIWLQSPDRNAVTVAAKEIESRLQEAPLSWGNELSEGLRAFTWSTSRVLFYIDDRKNVVRIVSVAPASRL